MNLEISFGQIDIEIIYENYSIFVLYVNAYNREVIVTRKNRMYQVTVLTIPSRFNFVV